MSAAGAAVQDDQSEPDATPLPPLPVRRTTLQAQVRDALEDLIVNGGLPPGERLAETVLAGRLGVSRQPVREALQALAALGFVDLSAGRGATVHVPSMREVRELFHVRAILEADVCALAARTIGEQDVDVLRRMCADGAAIARDADVRRLIEAHASFHRTVTRISGNSVAAEILDRLQRRVAWHVAPVAVALASESWHDHRAIVDALADADADLAHARMVDHVHRSVEALNALHR